MTTKKGKKTQEKWMPYEELFNSMQQVSESYKDLYDAWMDFRQGMNARIEKTAEESMKQYEDFSTKWSDFHKKVRTKTSKTEVPEAMELYDIWRNYSNKMYQRLSTAMDGTTERHRSLQENWKDLSKSFGNQLSALRRGEQMDWEQTALYDSWRGMTSHMQKWMEEFTQSTSKELGHLTDTWTKFSTEMGDAMRGLPSDADVYKDWVELWTGQASEMTKSLKDLTSENGGFEEIQKAWVNYLGRVESGVMEATKFFSPNYEEILDWYFESQDSWQKTLDSTLRKESEHLREQMKKLAKRVDKLEKSRR